jgi:hypothetical protein
LTRSSNLSLYTKSATLTGLRFQKIEYNLRNREPSGRAFVLYTQDMKKYITLIFVSTYVLLFKVSAMPPMYIDETPFNEVHKSLTFYEYLSTLSANSIFLVGFSQIVFVWFITRLLFRMHVSKTVQKEKVTKWFITLFSLAYLFAILVIVLRFLFPFIYILFN